ncbi:MAG: hypothetical protein GY679_03805 [Mycoplasma sp.]|nr:hypothetical protein [Mycoplasma sp.]
MPTNVLVWLILLLIFAVFLITNRKLTQRIFSTNAMWLLFGIGCMSYTIGLRIYEHTNVRGFIFNTDLCPFVQFWCPIVIMIPKLRKTIGKPVAIWTLVGGVASASAVLDHGVSNAESLSFSSFIFVPTVAGHTFQIVMGSIMLITASKITWKDIVKIPVTITLYLLFILVIMGIQKNDGHPLTNGTTGISRDQWIIGDYKIVPEVILGTKGMNIHVIRFTGWMMFLFAAYTFLFLVWANQHWSKIYDRKWDKRFIYQYYDKFFTSVNIKFNKRFGEKLKSLKNLKDKVKQINHNFWEDK